MDYKNIFVDQSTIRINVMNVGAKRLTKSLMDQISGGFPFDEDYNFIGEKVFGYVAMSITITKKPLTIVNFWGVYQQDGKLYRFDADRLRRVSELNLDHAHYKGSFLTFERVINKLKLEDKEIYKGKYLNEENQQFERYLIGSSDTFRDLFTDYIIERLETVISNAKKFVDELREHQIYI